MSTPLQRPNTLCCRQSSQCVCVAIMCSCSVLLHVCAAAECSCIVLQKYSGRPPDANYSHAALVTPHCNNTVCNNTPKQAIPCSPRCELFPYSTNTQQRHTATAHSPTTHCNDTTSWAKVRIVPIQQQHTATPHCNTLQHTAYSSSDPTHPCCNTHRATSS